MFLYYSIGSFRILKEKKVSLPYQLNMSNRVKIASNKVPYLTLVGVQVGVSFSEEGSLVYCYFLR